MITALYAGLLTILLFVLSIRVIGLRGNPVFSFIAHGKGDEELLQRAIRAHIELHRVCADDAHFIGVPRTFRRL